ncbi:MAG: hypothetical protein JWM78_1676 [Verrucomicrobiaceae bacterium]|nr:hypothetical protein [Verrucomicrobiaceae bacterium]
MTAINSQRRAKKIAEQSARITAIRDQLRDANLTVAAGFSVQADPDSVLMMQETIDQWDSITHMRDAESNQLWKDATNEKRAFSRDEFIAFVAEVRARRAARMDINFAFAELKRAALPLPDDDGVFDSTQWPG